MLIVGSLQEHEKVTMAHSLSFLLDSQASFIFFFLLVFSNWLIPLAIVFSHHIITDVWI